MSKKVKSNENTQNESEENTPSIDPMNVLNNLFGSQNTQKKSNFDMEKFSQAFDNIIQALTFTKDESLKKLSDLNENSIVSLSFLETITREYYFPSLSTFLESFLKFRISKERKGREEIMQLGMMLQQLHQSDIQANSPFFGGFGGISPMMNQQMPNNPALTGNDQIKKRRFRFF